MLFPSNQVAVGLAVAACAGRDAQPAATVQPQDAYSDCSMINAEIQANNSRAQERSHTPMHIKEIRRIAEQLSQSDALCLQRIADQLYERGLKLELLQAAIPPQGEPDIKAARKVLYALET
jgi:hypothetical protein